MKCLKEQSFKVKNILDLNCGIGRHSIELGKRGIKVSGLISHHFNIKIAKKEAKEEKVADKLRFKIAGVRKVVSMLSGKTLLMVLLIYPVPLAFTTRKLTMIFCNNAIDWQNLVVYSNIFSLSNL